MFVSELGGTMTSHDESESWKTGELLSKREVDTELLASIFAKSKDKVDQRLSKLYKIAKARHVDKSVKLKELEVESISSSNSKTS